MKVTCRAPSSALRDAAPTLDRAALVAYVANYWDLYWALDSADRALPLTLPPSAYDGDRGTWADRFAHRQYWMTRDTVAARRWADSAKTSSSQSSFAAAPNDFQRHAFHALALAYLGRPRAAIQEGKHACDLAECDR